MAFNFPSSPANGQVFTPPGGPAYVYDLADAKWLVATGQAAAGDDRIAVFDSADYLGAQFDLVTGGNSAGQDAAAVTAALRALHDAAMAALQAATAGSAQNVCIYIRHTPGLYALNGEMFSEAFAQNLWTLGSTGSSRVVFELRGCIYQAKGWPAQAAVRTSGYYLARGITAPVPTVMFRWEAKPTEGPIGPGIMGSPTFRGELALTDPIAMKFRSTNDSYLENVMFRRFRNIALFVEAVNNSTIQSGSIQSCGYQPTQAGGNGFLASATTFNATPGAGVTTIVASAATFVADHVGKWFMVEGGGTGGAAFASRITSVTNPTTVVTDAQAAATVTGKHGSFAAIQGSISANSASLVLDTAVTDSLVGRYVAVWKAGSKLHTSQGILVTRVIAQAGDNKTLTLASQARSTVASVPVIVAPMRYIGLSDDFVDNAGVAIARQNDDLQIFDQRMENFGLPATGSAVCSLNQTNSAVEEFGVKYHGDLQSSNNFGANMASAIYDHCEVFVQHGCHHASGGWAPAHGQMLFCGELMHFFMRDCVVGGARLSHYAQFYVDPQVAGIADFLVNVAGGHFNNFATWGGANQTGVRLGANGQNNNVVIAGMAAAGNGRWADNWAPVLTIVKSPTSPSTVNNTTTLTDVPEFVFVISPNETVIVDFAFRYLSQAAADFKFQFVAPAGSTATTFLGNPRTSPAGIGGSGLISSGGDCSFEGFGFDASAPGKAVIVNGATAGTVQLKFAQNTANVSDTQILGRSNMSIARQR